ncbi:MAG: hypothetical protein ACW98K_16975 [Candidatus Kariarchaeaceae archaeon]
MGLRDIERKITTKSAYQRKEAELLLQELDQLIENVETLKKDLRKFEKKHGKDIQSNKDYYEKISLLREEIYRSTKRKGLLRSTRSRNYGVG